MTHFFTATLSYGTFIYYTEGPDDRVMVLKRSKHWSSKPYSREFYDLKAAEISGRTGEIFDNISDFAEYLKNRGFGKDAVNRLIEVVL